MTSIEHDDYQITYEETTTTLTCQGALRLRSMEYKPIIELLSSVAESTPEHITLDVRQLRFLNSSGINALSKFVIQVRKLKASQMTVLGSTAHPWQKRSLKNLQRLKKDLTLEIE